MDREEYIRIAEVGENMWWFRALHRNLLCALEAYLPDFHGYLLDGGCGPGGFLRKCGYAFKTLLAVGLDLDQKSVGIARRRSTAEAVIGSVNCLPFQNDRFTAYISADVLYHQAAVPEDTLSEAFRCLRTGGILVVSVPAYEWMYSNHDRRVGGARRYTRASLSRILELSGFEIEYITYWNTFLFGLMVLRRKVFSSPTYGSDLKLMPYPIELLFNAIMTCEGMVLSLGMRLGLTVLPFGGSVLAVARRPITEQR